MIPSIDRYYYRHCCQYCYTATATAIDTAIGAAIAISIGTATATANGNSYSYWLLGFVLGVLILLCLGLILLPCGAV